MSINPASPPTGWYPAPNGTSEMWWWDGAQWAPPPETQTAPLPPIAGLVRLSNAIQLLLVFSTIVSLAILGLEVFGLDAVERYAAGDSSAMGLLETYDQIYIPLAIGAAVAIIATGTLWAIWQYKAARRVLGRTRRTPGWHAGSWFIPVVCFWFPYQNISDLWRAIGRSRPSWQVAWWVLWLLNNVVTQISVRISLNAETFEDISAGMGTSILGEALNVGAAILAIMIVRGLTRGMQQHTTTPAVSQPI